MERIAVKPLLLDSPLQWPPLYNSHSLLSQRWPFWTGSTVDAFSGKLQDFMLLHVTYICWPPCLSLLIGSFFWPYFQQESNKIICKFVKPCRPHPPRGRYLGQMLLLQKELWTERAAGIIKFTEVYIILMSTF